MMDVIKYRRQETNHVGSHICTTAVTTVGYVTYWLKIPPTPPPPPNLAPFDFRLFHRLPAWLLARSSSPIASSKAELAADVTALPTRLPASIPLPSRFIPPATSMAPPMSAPTTFERAPKAVLATTRVAMRVAAFFCVAATKPANLLRFCCGMASSWGCSAVETRTCGALLSRVMEGLVCMSGAVGAPG